MTINQPAFPRSGDVIFVRSKGREALASCLLQRMVLNPSVGPLFSHVAVALSDRVAIEASTAVEEDESTWSGATLGEGVRLQLLPDLILGAAGCSVLRHPSEPDLSHELDVHTRYISQLLGSGYSTKALVDKARKGHSFLAALLPADSFNWTGNPDRMAAVLRDDANLRAGIERHLRSGEALDSLNDYFCSQLVAVILDRAQLVQKPLGLVTPCVLYDELVRGGWKDVTTIAYGSATIATWKRRSREDWQLFFREDVGFAKWFRDAGVGGPMIDLAAEMLTQFGHSLDETRRELQSRYRQHDSQSPPNAAG